ncbi:MAG: hypothetical protein CMB22_01695 [Euryarchaeota archaeon]|nr:hypothetical protein [Euryarchaeota archaeon]
MVMGDEALEESLNAPIGAISAPEVPEGPTSESLELMESIIQRLQPSDRHDIRDMISYRAQVSGGMIAMTLVFWWITIDKGAESLGDSEIPLSAFGGFTFREISMIVPALSLLATLVMSIGRETGNAILNNIGGGLIVLVVFYISEPFGSTILGSGIDAQSAAFASGRLVAMALMIGLATKFFWDAILLQWVRSTMMNMGVDLFPSEEQEEFGSHADEAPPLG